MAPRTLHKLACTEVLWAAPADGKRDLEVTRAGDSVLRWPSLPQRGTTGDTHAHEGRAACQA